MKLFSTFCGSTSLHGWPHFPEAQGGLAKLFWLTTILGSISMAVFLSMR